MIDLTGKYDVYFNSELLSEPLKIVQNGLFQEFILKCHIVTEDVLRLICRSGGNNISMGVMIPKNGLLCFIKKFSQNSISLLGISQIENFYLIPASAFDPNDLISQAVESKSENIDKAEDIDKTQDIDKAEDIGNFAIVSNSNNVKWFPIDNPSSLFLDPELKSICSSVHGALVKKENDSITYLAISLSPSSPFPMMPIFCFGTSEVIEGKPYAVFTIKNGYLAQ